MCILYTLIKSFKFFYDTCHLRYTENINGSNIRHKKGRVCPKVISPWTYLPFIFITPCCQDVRIDLIRKD